MREYLLLVEGYDKKQRVYWEVARWQQWHNLQMSPNIKKEYKQRVSTPQKFMPLAWDIPEREMSLEDRRITEEQREILNKIAEDFYKRKRDGQDR